jgi:hypothetical protein
VALDVGLDEGAEGKHGKPPRAGIVESKRDQAAAETLTLEAVVDLGMDKSELPRPLAVLRETRQLTV